MIVSSLTCAVHVVAVTGDGGFLMNSQELETATRLETPFVVLVFNDRSFGLIRWKQMQQFDQPAFVDFTNPAFVKYAESFGANGYRIESADELAPALRTRRVQTGSRSSTARWMLPRTCV